MLRILIIGLIICFGRMAKAQELFPYAESASTIPKGVVGLRFVSHNFKELSSSRTKSWYGLRVMYGITSKWTIMSTLGVSNHHFKKFPPDILQYLFNHHLNISKPANNNIEGVNLYSKYRFFTYDQFHKHLRLSLITEAGKSFIAHDEAEPTLMTDNSGVGVGLIGTLLINRFAISTTIGHIHPFIYKQKDHNFTFKSGDGNYAIVSAGYRLSPAIYSAYSNFNINIYAEFSFKQYGAAEITQNGASLDYRAYYLDQPYAKQYSYNALIKNNYTEGRFFIQLIGNSNSRIDVGLALALKSRSYNYWSPMFTIQYQTFLFKNKKESILIKKKQ